MKDKIIKELPLEFSQIRYDVMEDLNIKEKDVSIGFYQTHRVHVDFFYKSISRIFCFEEEN